MSTLYRKYRPQSFTEVIGQSHVKIILQNELEQDKIGHAYLFCGPRGLGKTTLARLFAKSVNCENRKEGKSEPCNECSSCTSIVASSSVDIIEIDAASHTGVDNVRENIIENSRFTPNISKYKVFIIDEVHMLSISAFNALLKTLEEPPAHVIFILCTTESHKLPQTIISRCQRFDLKKVTSKELKGKLERIVKEEGKKVDSDVLDNIVVHSEGCVRDSESLLGKVLTLGDEITSQQAELVLPKSDFSKITSLLSYISESNSTEAIKLINVLVDDGIDLQSFVDNLLEFLRKVMLLKVNGSLSDFGIELDEINQKSAEDLASKFEYEYLLRIIDIFMQKRVEIKSALIPQFPLEMAVIELSEEKVVNSNVDDSDTSGDSGSEVENADISRPQRVKEKIKDGLSHLNPRKHKDDKEDKVPLEHIEVKKEKVDEVKVDMTSKHDKLGDKQVVKFSKVKENWKEVVVRTMQENYTLASLLRIGEPLRCDGNVLEIGVKSKFYHDRLTDLNGRPLVERIISEVLQANVRIRPIIKEVVTPIPMELDSSDQAGNSAATTKEPQQSALGAISPVDTAKPADAAQDVSGMF